MDPKNPWQGSPKVPKTQIANDHRKGKQNHRNSQQGQGDGFRLDPYDSMIAYDIQHHPLKNLFMQGRNPVSTTWLSDRSIRVVMGWSPSLGAHFRVPESLLPVLPVVILEAAGLLPRSSSQTTTPQRPPITPQLYHHHVCKGGFF